MRVCWLVLLLMMVVDRFRMAAQVQARWLVVHLRLHQRLRRATNVSELLVLLERLLLQLHLLLSPRLRLLLLALRLALLLEGS